MEDTAMNICRKALTITAVGALLALALAGCKSEAQKEATQTGPPPMKAKFMSGGPGSTGQGKATAGPEGTKAPEGAKTPGGAAK
jgi:hypothetical protein